MRSRTLLNVSLAIFALVAAYGLGAHRASAQANGSPVVALTVHQSGALYAVTSNGDVYSALSSSGPWHHDSNIFAGGGPTSVQQQTLGQVKVRYR